jgi:1,2-diacylglycerol 3-alpha-glucosyltransferase
MYEDYIHYITKGYFDKPGKKIVEYITKFYCDKTTKELIVPTKKTYDLFKEKYKFDRNVHIIPTGIEIEHFYTENSDKHNQDVIRMKYHIEKDDFIILFVGRIAEEKSIDFLIENHVSLVHKNKKAKLLIVGDGPDREQLMNLSKKLKIQDNVIFTGKVPWNEITDYYNIADVFTTASHTETQGLTVIEAMAASLPVVALDDEAFNTIIINDLNGYLFKDKKGYRNVMEKLIDNKELCEKLGTQARVNSDSYSSRYYAERVIDVYKIALEGREDNEGRSFFDKAKDVVRRGFHGK